MSVQWIWITCEAGDDYLLNINTGATFTVGKDRDLWVIRNGAHVVLGYESDEEAVYAMTKLGEQLGAEYPSVLVGG